jgi:hypothetical protein
LAAQNVGVPPAGISVPRQSEAGGIGNSSSSGKFVQRLPVRNFIGWVSPEMGKTAIALTIALARFTDDWQIVDCRHPDDYFALLDPDSKQIFIADDAFGSTEYRPELAAEWARDLKTILAGSDKEHALIWTSRPAPLREGLKRLDFQGASRTFPDPGRVKST